MNGWDSFCDCSIKSFALLPPLLRESWFPFKFIFLTFLEEELLNSSVIVSSVIDFFFVIILFNSNSLISP